ncbi:MAG: HsdR family type I site-specific deoxyribonuclease [Nitrospirae bacterium]|nr:HsdR family type I site-specific deoxyribonuclease [Nitrospirota bacterium]
MGFNEASTVRDAVRDYLIPLGWKFISRSQLSRAENEVFVIKDLVDALIRLNPEIAKQPDRADEVIYKLRAALYSVRSDGLVSANEEFASWLTGEHSMQFGKNGEHVPVKIIDFDDLSKNKYVVTTEYSFTSDVNKRMDIVLLVNGIPLVIGECKTPVRNSVSWVDGAVDIHDDYEKTVSALFVPNVFSFATEGKTYRYGAIRASLDNWFPWREVSASPSALFKVIGVVTDMLKPAIIMDILKNFSVYATDKNKQKIKIICRHQQFEAANKIVQRVENGRPKKGLIWHFQGSGKSLLMVFAAQKLRIDPLLKNPTVLIVVDRIDLDTQITAEFNTTEIPNTIVAESRTDLEKMLAQDTRKIIITTIHKFGEAEGILNSRDNIILMCDEAHQTQEGDMALKMRTALPNAFFFGLTGTPINRRDHNTFRTFGAEEDENRYLSKYSFEESIKDKATLPLHFEPRMVKYHVDRQSIDDEIALLTEGLDDVSRRELVKRAGQRSVFIHARERIKDISKDVIDHYRERVEPNGFKAMLVCYDREACKQYKAALDEIFPADGSEIIMTVPTSADAEEKRLWDRSREEEDAIKDRFRDHNDPLKILIVTAKLLKGFNAPILQVMYLDKFMKDEALLQAVTRTNRPFPEKSFGWIVDYIGVFDNVAKTLTFDEKEMEEVLKNLDELVEELPVALDKCLAYFDGVDRSISGYEGLIAAQECLPTNDIKDNFAAEFSVLSRIWEAVSPDESLNKYKEDYRWLSGVYESVKPPSGIGKLVWHNLGAKTLEIVNEHVHVESIRDDLETLILDEETVQDIFDSQDPKQMKIIEIRIIRRLQKHLDNPVFVALGEKLEKVKKAYEDGFMNSLEYIKELLELARETVEAEKEIEPEEEQKKAKAALTELFEEIRTDKVPIMVERIVNDIDDIVKQVRFDDWQHTHAGERLVQQALRQTLKKYQLHHNQDLFDRAYGYIKQYY